MKHLIKTQLEASRINGRRIRYTSPDSSILDVDAMLEAWPKPDGTMSVSVVAPYAMRLLGSRPQRVTEYGFLTQEELDLYMAE